MAEWYSSMSTSMGCVSRIDPLESPIQNRESPNSRNTQTRKIINLNSQSVSSSSSYCNFHNHWLFLAKSKKRRLEATERRKKAIAEAKDNVEQLRKTVNELTGLVRKLMEKSEDTVMENPKDTEQPLIEIE